MNLRKDHYRESPRRHVAGFYKKTKKSRGGCLPPDPPALPSFFRVVGRGGASPDARVTLFFSQLCRVAAPCGRRVWRGVLASAGRRTAAGARPRPPKLLHCYQTRKKPLAVPAVRLCLGPRGRHLPVYPTDTKNTYNSKRWITRLVCR